MKSPSSVLVIRDEIHVSPANNRQPEPTTCPAEETSGNSTFHVLFIICYFFSFSLSLSLSLCLPFFFGIHFSDDSGESLVTIRKERWIRSSADPRDKCIIPKEMHVGIKAPRSHHSLTPMRSSTTLTWKYPLLCHLLLPLFIHPLESIL